MNETEIRMYESICRHDGIKAGEITREIPVCSGDMLLNAFDEFIGFLK